MSDSQNILRFFSLKNAALALNFIIEVHDQIKKNNELERSERTSEQEEPLQAATYAHQELTSAVVVHERYTL